MSWMKLDDAILDHPKFIRAARNGGSEAIHLWLGLRAWCAQSLSDGFVPGDMVDEVRGPKRGREKALATLVQVGLVKEMEGGWQLHDYLDWSDSREEVLDARRKAAARQKAAREKRAAESRDHVPKTSRRDSRCDADDASLRDGEVTGPLVTGPPRARTETDTETTPPPLPPNPRGGGGGDGGKVRCPRDLSLAQGQVAQAELQGISAEAVAALTAKFRGSWCDREGELRTRDQWRAGLNTAVHRDGRDETLRLRRAAKRGREDEGEIPPELVG